MDYLRAAGLVEPLEALGFHLAGFGCMTCIGASGPLIEEVAAGTMDLDLTGDPLGHDPQGRPVFLADLWPSAQEVD